MALPLDRVGSPPKAAVRAEECIGRRYVAVKGRARPPQNRRERRQRPPIAAGGYFTTSTGTFEPWMTLWDTLPMYSFKPDRPRLPSTTKS